MKILAFSFLFSLFTIASFGQNLEPVSWEFKVNKLEDGTFELVSTAKIKDNWAIYSQHTEKGGPIALSFSYNDGIVLEGVTKELTEPIKTMSDLFEIEVIKFKKEAVFTQKFVPNPDQKSITGYLTFMCCDNLRCLPPTDVAFDVAL